MTDNNMTFGWDDTIENDGAGFIILPEGDYNFTVMDFERGRFPGSAKIPPCNKAVVTLGVVTPEGLASVKTDLILARNMEWQLSSFFRCIGQKKHGQKLVMNWDTIIGSQGRAHFKPRAYTDRNGDERQANDVANFIDYNPDFFKKEESDPINQNSGLPWDGDLF